MPNDDLDKINPLNGNSFNSTTSLTRKLAIDPDVTEGDEDDDDLDFVPKIKAPRSVHARENEPPAESRVTLNATTTPTQEGRVPLKSNSPEERRVPLESIPAPKQSPKLNAEKRKTKVPRERKPLVLRFEDDESGGSEEEEKKEKPRLREPKATAAAGERIVMTDESEEDTVRAEFKRRQADAVKKASNPTRKRSTGGTGASTGSKRPKLGHTSAPDTQETGMRNALPSYLQRKKQEMVEARKGLERGDKSCARAFKTPPDWEDVVFSDDEHLELLESRPVFDNPPSAPYQDIHLEGSGGVVPCSIAQYLRSYQVEGVRFLHRNFVFQEGCVLGDDMGLGKTVQVIAFLTAAFGKTGDARDDKRMRKMRQFNSQQKPEHERWCPKVLVICPSTLIQNWKSEFETWGWWHVEVYHGGVKAKENALSAAKKGSLEIMITNYDTYRINYQDINMVAWDCVIADECHKIKERSSETTQRMNDINALCRIGLTGTAIQNNYEELWTLLNWCRPGEIGTVKEWEKEIAGPLRMGQKHDATFSQIGKARRVANLLVNNLLPQMFLRRMKTLIAHQLPKKSDKVVFCPLTETQREAYENFLESDTVRRILRADELCDCGSEKKIGKCCHPGDGSKDTEERPINELVFPAITWVQKLSNHLANWIPDNADSAGVRAQKIDLLQTCLPHQWRELTTRQSLLNYMDPQMCGKWAVLQKLLNFWYQNGDKVLIFSYSLKLLGILLALFNNTDYNLCYLDGSMPLADRAKAVDNFNNDPNQFVFLISTKAGGVGLNITAANKVVIFDPNWNPAYDLQAQDRAYRIGQKRDVEVFRLISSGTIEEIVYARQIYKQQQANIGYGASEERRYFTGVMGDKQNMGELFGLKNLFSFQDNTILQEIVNKTNVAERKAGVRVADMDADASLDAESDLDSDSSDGVLHAISQLAGGGDAPKRKTKKPKHPSNPVSAILAAAGVSYTHENSEVIGTSAVEARISKRAMEDDSSTGDMRAFDVDEEGGFRFNPPEDVRRRQFCTAAKMLGFTDVREFALVVEGWSQKQRRHALERFYRARIEEKADIIGERGGGAAQGDAAHVDVEMGVSRDLAGTHIRKEMGESLGTQVGLVSGPPASFPGGVAVKRETDKKEWNLGTTIDISDDEDDEL